MRTSNLAANTSSSTVESITEITSPDTLTSQDHVTHHLPPPEYTVEESIKNAGYKPLRQIDDALQGSVWLVANGKNSFVVKVASKSLHKQHVTYLNGERIEICEDILQERDILKHLCSHEPHRSLVTYKDFFEDAYNYFLVQSFGGSMSLFDFVQKCHAYIEEGVISIIEWQSVCKNIMQQIVDLMDWLHNKMHVCHLDVSLENFVIDNVMILKHTDSKQIRFAPDFKCSLIDFGVAEVFSTKIGDKIDFKCNKYVGKTLYKSPELYGRKKSFDAKAADCWSLAIVFFLMIAGCPPFSEPSLKDEEFKAIMGGSLKDLLFHWDRLRYTTPNMLNLMQCLFQKEEHRATINNVKTHPFLL